MYVSTEKDVDKYIGVYGRYLKKIGKNVVLKELQVSGNLKVPSYKQSKEIMKHTLDSLAIKDDPKKIELLNKHFNESMFTDDYVNDLYRKAGSDFKKYLKNGSVGNNLYDCLNVDLCFRRSKIMQEIATEFYRKNNHFGYDAVKDMNDVKYSLYKSNLPLIITNIDKVSSTKIRELTDSDINRSRTKLGQKYLSRFNQWDKEVDEWLAEEKKNNK